MKKVIKNITIIYVNKVLEICKYINAKNIKKFQMFMLGTQNVWRPEV